MTVELAIGTAPVSAIAAEATNLRELVVQVCPRIGLTLEPLALEPEAPEWVRVFWETFGWTDALDERGWLVRPEVAAGRQRARRLRTEIKRSGVQLQHEQLPQNYRLADVDSGGLGFTITNEDGDAADPPVMVVSASNGVVTQLHPSYLNYCANRLVRRSFRHWPELRIHFSTYDFLATADVPLPLLSPATRRLAPGVWLVPDDDLVVQPGPSCHPAYQSLAALTRWLNGLPDDLTLDLWLMPDDAIEIESFSYVEALLDAGARSFPGTGPGERIIAGAVEGRPVLVWQLPALSKVATEASEVAWLREKLDQQRAASPPPVFPSAPRGPVRDEDLAALDELVSVFAPQHRATKKAVELEPDAPADMRRLWEVLGASDATAAHRVLGRAALERVFATWFRDSESREAWGVADGPEAYFATLPARYRLLSQSSDTIVFTDEAGATDDPPVLLMRRRERTIDLVCRSYVEWLLWELLVRMTLARSARFNVLSGVRGERVLPSLYPQMERLGEGLYWMRSPHPQARPPYLAHAFFTTHDVYFRWVLSLPDEELRFADPPAGKTFYVAPSDDWDLWRGRRTVFGGSTKRTRGESFTRARFTRSARLVTSICGCGRMPGAPCMCSSIQPRRTRSARFSGPTECRSSRDDRRRGRGG